MVICIPPLRKRTFEERLYLIKNFFKEESIRLSKEIYVSLNSMRALLSYNCPNNVGQLKSDIQLICAKSYSLYLTNKKDDVRIVSRNLPSYIQDGLYKEKEHRSIWNKLIGEEIDFFKFSAKSTDSFSFDNNDSGIYSFIKNKLKNTKSNGGYLLLVDMGSFTTFAEIIEDEFNIPAKVVPLVSTLHVLEAARKALMKSSLNSIYKDVLMVNSYINVGKNNKPPEKKKTLILSACLTCKGGSIAIKNFLKDTFTIDENIFEIMVIDCLDKNNFINNINNLYEKYNILFIVTPFSLDINMNIPHFTMYEVLNLSTKAKIQELLDVETTLANMPEVLKENITAIPSNNLYEKIMNFIASVEKSLNIFISHKKKVELILHLAFAINRLITNEDMVEYSNKTSIKKSYNKLYSTVKSSLIPIETYFSIKLTDDEICYIMDFIIN